ncbi:hypothetical protein OC846_004232 [Tilletia horrida]|uniref:Alpha-1,6-mannosyltransferase n=1 Tax=Tilletia horrida TaxID=155126 RepID=A0AAN6JQL0_9BASI|nr:hypothetical protein OC845_005920 [Tilletia horrida]KAK0549075.1 hypothetical protein OC846_004232 [Tilletia horrida]KAK0564644.1 hypothetical protein OC861_004173 [Tilletia horrida]
MKKNGGAAYTRLRPLSSSGGSSPSPSPVESHADDGERDWIGYRDLETGRAHGGGPPAEDVDDSAYKSVVNPFFFKSNSQGQALQQQQQQQQRRSKNIATSSRKGQRRIWQLLGAAVLFFALACWLYPPIPYWLGLAERYRPRNAIGTSSSDERQPRPPPPASGGGTTTPGTAAGEKMLLPPPPRYEVTADEMRAYRLWSNSTSRSKSNSEHHDTHRTTTAATQEQPQVEEPLSWVQYQSQLDNFLSEALSTSPMLAEIRQRLHTRFFLSSEAVEPIPADIWETAKRRSDFEGAASRSFARMNNDDQLGHSGSKAGTQEKEKEHWAEHLLADPEPSEWALKTFGPNSALAASWNTLDRGVMRADVWRYAILAFQGGLYSDLDTTSLQPVREWTSADKVVVWDVGAPPELRDGPPQLIVGLEADTLGVHGWEAYWPRPIQIVQWTLAGAQAHPVLLDVLRRIHNTLQHVEQFRSQSRSATTHPLRKNQDGASASSSSSSSSLLLQQQGGGASRRGWLWPSPPSRTNSTSSSTSGRVDPFDTAHGGLVSVVEATGPGVWTDSVFAYLECRYGVHWSQLHGLKSVVRIGEVAILPLTGLSPTDDEDGRVQRWERIGIRRGPMAEVGGVRDRYANVHHAFAGSWRKSGDTNA